MIRLIRPAIVLAAASAIPAGWCSSALAADAVWTGLSTTSSEWSDPANWGTLPPPNNGTADIIFQASSPRLDPTHGPWSVHSLTFRNTLASYDVRSTGPLTFARDLAHQFAPQPVVANDGSTRPAAVRGNFVLPADAVLQARAVNSTLTLGDADRIAVTVR